MSILHKKIDITQQAIDEAQKSANNETKSSAGDKYETGRAMSQNERNMNAKHMVELLNMKKIFLSIDPEKTLDTVELGSIAQTKVAVYFISAALGKVSLNGTNVFAISAISPIAQAMLGKARNEHFEWQGKSQELINIR